MRFEFGGFGRRCWGHGRKPHERAGLQLKVAPAAPIASASPARANVDAWMAWLTWFLATASSASARDSSAPGRSWLCTNVRTVSANVCSRLTLARAARTASSAARTLRNASAAAAAASSSVSAACAPARVA